MAKKIKPTECPRCNAESGSGRWMLTYLDMVTLLFGVFIIMYALSKQDEHKFDQVAQALRAGFSNGGISQSLGNNAGGTTAFENLNSVGSQTSVPKFTLHANILEKLRAQNVAVQPIESGYKLILSGDVAFAPGEWKIRADQTLETLRFIATLADALPSDYHMEVVGHTDDTPVGADDEARDVIESNWELSTLRAASVAHALEMYGVNPSIIKASGRAEYEPVAPNDSPVGRAENRRVEIYITGEGGRLARESEEVRKLNPQPIGGGFSKPIPYVAPEGEGGGGH